MKKLKVILMAAICLTLTGCSTSKEAASAIEETPQAVENTLDIYGDVMVDKTEEIVIDFPAEVTEVLVKEGERVEAGTPLFNIDYENYKREIKEKQLTIQADEVELKRLQSTTDPAVIEAEEIREKLIVKKGYIENDNDPEILPLRNSLELADTELEKAKKAYETNKNLYDAGAVSEDELKASKDKIDAKQKEIDDLNTSIEKIKTDRSLEVQALETQLKVNAEGVGNTENEKASSIESLKLKLEIEKLGLEAMQSKLNKAYLKDNQIIAPAGGLIVSDIIPQKGSRIDSSIGAIVKLMYSDSIYVTADIPEESQGRVKVGDKVEVSVEGEEKTLIGSIERLPQKAIEKDGDTIIEGVVKLEEGNETLKPGLSADITIYLT